MKKTHPQLHSTSCLPRTRPVTLPDIKIQYHLTFIMLSVGLHPNYLHSLLKNKIKYKHFFKLLSQWPTFSRNSCYKQKLRIKFKYEKHMQITQSFIRTRFVYPVAQVNFGEAESSQMSAGGSDRRGNSLQQQLLQILSNKRPGLLQYL